MKALVSVVVIVAGVILGITVYLSPNDLSGCGEAPSGECAEADAIIAISGGDTPARTDEAIQLYKNGWADKLILSGAALDKTGPSNAEVMRQRAINAGVPDDDIHTEDVSETTKQNAEQVQGVLREIGANSVILVTSAYHQKRAGLEFQWILGEDIEVINRPVSEDKQWSNFWWLTPTGWYLAGSELGKIVAFYFGGSR